MSFDHFKKTYRNVCGEPIKDMSQMQVGNFKLRLAGMTIDDLLDEYGVYNAMIQLDPNAPFHTEVALIRLEIKERCRK